VTGEKGMASELSMKWVLGCVAAALMLSACGCAGLRGRVPASEYSIPEVSAEVEGEFKQIRDVVRDVLRESPVEIYTRDKRGRFVVFAEMRRAFLTPRRLRLVVTLARVAERSTRVTVQTFPEAYITRLLTYPAWRPAAFGDDSLAKEIVTAIEKRVSEVVE
jgi:hypothetical protein